jgi:hypothetical protein
MVKGFPDPGIRIHDLAEAAPRIRNRIKGIDSVVKRKNIISKFETKLSKIVMQRVNIPSYRYSA